MRKYLIIALLLIVSISIGLFILRSNTQKPIAQPEETSISSDTTSSVSSEPKVEQADEIENTQTTEVTSNRPSNQQVEKIMRLSKAEDTFLQIEKQLEDALLALENDPEFKKGMTTEKWEKVQAFLENFFSNGQEMATRFAEKLMADFSIQELAEIERVFSEPLLQKMIHDSENTSQQEKIERYNQFAQEIEKNGYDSAREKLVDDYAQKTQLVKQAVNMSTNIGLAVTVAKKQLTDLSEIVSTRQKIFEAVEKQDLYSHMKQPLHFEFNNLSTEELQQVVNYYTTSAMIKYSQAILDVMVNNFISNQDAVNSLAD